MQFELALKLKNVGFSQKIEIGDRYFSYKISRVFGETDEYGEILSLPQTYTKIPTLSGLIDACGDDLIAIHKIKRLGVSCWQVMGRGDINIIDEYIEIAVANLYLEINK